MPAHIAHGTRYILVILESIDKTKYFFFFALQLLCEFDLMLDAGCWVRIVFGAIVALSFDNIALST